MRAVINVALGKGYERGQLRLGRSLGQHYRFAFINFQVWPPWDHSKDTPYAAKAAAIQYAITQGYTTVLWLDASCIVAGDLTQLFEDIERDGVYMPSSGYNCAQTCNDKILEYFSITRDQAELIPDAATGCFGISTTHPKGIAFARMFIQAAKDGMFSGSRNHDGQSQDPRFLFHRQDQSAAGLICHHLGIEKHDFGHRCGYYPKTTPTQVVQFKGIS